MFQIEEYWFVCNRWFAKGEDDGKIVRELLPTTEGGVPLDTGLSGRLSLFTLLQYNYVLLGNSPYTSIYLYKQRLSESKYVTHIFTT